MSNRSIHVLKTWPDSYDAIATGSKTFELRKEDRNYEVGDRLDLMKFDPITQTYTGEHQHVWVTYIMNDGNPLAEQAGLLQYVIMSITKEPQGIDA